jgi:ABC-type branched-subunit amino acid transport system substrate-binding protein
VDPRQIGREAQRVKGTWAKTIVYMGDPATGGNLLRTLRNVNSKIEFFGVGLYDISFLDAAGPEASQNAVVTAGDRPCLDPAIRDGFQQRFGAPPIAAALDAYDAARLLRTAYETAEIEGDQNRVEGTRARIKSVEAAGIAGSIKIGPDNSPDPDWCTAFIVKQNRFHYRGVARANDAHTLIEIVHESGKVLPTLESAGTPPVTAAPSPPQ